MAGGHGLGLRICYYRGFTRPPVPRLATAPTNRPRRSLSSPGAWYAANYSRPDAELRCGGRGRGAGRRGGGGAARGGRPAGGDRGGPARRGRVLVLGVHALEVAAAAIRGAGRGQADPRRRGGRDRRAGRAGGAEAPRRGDP